MPVTTLDIIAAALPAEPNYRTRGALIYALAYAAADYPPATAVLKKALSSPDPNTVQAADQDSDIAVAAIGLFRRFARSPIDDFDSTILIPALKHAMVDADPAIRHAAYSVLSTIARRLPNYLGDADLLIDLEPA